jgi:hypothetical protein
VSKSKDWFSWLATAGTAFEFSLGYDNHELPKKWCENPKKSYSHCFRWEFIQNMDDNNPIIYGLEFQSRALTSQGPVSNDNVVFYVATQSLKPNNQIHKILINEEEKLESQVKFGVYTLVNFRENFIHFLVDLRT